VNENSRFKIQGSKFKIRVPGFRVVNGAIILLLILSSTAYAHKVSIYAYAEDGMIHSEGYFADGTRSRNSRVEVFDARTGEKLLEGRTDNEGRFSFRIPRAASIRLVLHASMGHRNDYTLSEGEVKEALGIPEQETGQQEEPEGKPRSDAPPPPTPRSDTTPAAGAPSAEMEAMVERVMDRKLQPVITMLLKLQEEAGRPGTTEILGGIGYIIGLMGMAMYFKNRRKG